MLAMQMGAPNCPQWFNTGLHWAYGIDGPGQGHFYVDHETGQLTASTVGLRASPAARLLHPVDRGRSRQRERHHGPVGARGAPVQVRLRHRHQLLQAALGEREAVGRRQIVGPDELPAHRRSRRRRHQVRRHDAPGRQDGGGRHRPSRHRVLHRLEGEGGAEGRRPRHRLQDLPAAAQGHHEGLRQLRGGGRGLLRGRQEPGAQARHQGSAPRPGARQPDPPRRPVRTPGLQGHRVRRPTTPTGTARPISPSRARTPTTRCA